MILSHLSTCNFVGDIETVHLHEIIHHSDMVVLDRIQFQTDNQDVFVTLYVFSLDDLLTAENHVAGPSLVISVVFNVLGEGETFENVYLRQVDDDRGILAFRLNYPFAVDRRREFFREIRRLQYALAAAEISAAIFTGIRRDGDER